MVSTAGNSLTAELEAAFGSGRPWTSPAGSSATIWETATYHLMWAAGDLSEPNLRRLWEDRKGHQAFAVILLAPSDDSANVRVIGPQAARPMRQLPAGRVLALLQKSRGLVAREAASFLGREFRRLEEFVVPGLRVKDLLTPHFVRERLRWPVNEQLLKGAVDGIAPNGRTTWRTLFEKLGYRIEQLAPSRIPAEAQQCTGSDRPSTQ